MFRKSCVALAALSLALAFAACGSTKRSTSTTNNAAASGGTANANAQIKKGLTIAFLPKQVNNPYFTISDNGGLSALKELGETGKRVGPSDASASSQVSYINTLTSQKVDAIAISANDPNAVVPALKKAMAQGIKVVTYDSDTAPAGRQVFINQASPEALGRSEEIGRASCRERGGVAVGGG